MERGPVEATAMTDAIPAVIGRGIGEMAGRGIGEMAVVSSFPAPILVLFALITQLGDPWFVFSLLTATYWLVPRGIDRDEAATVFALATLAATLIVGLKVTFALPRPPGALEATAPAWLPAPLGAVYLDTATDRGFGFPSGHAMAATVVYGGLAVVLDRGTRRRRLAAAATLIVAVSLSRIVLQLHYLLDVVAGALLGLAVVGVGLSVSRLRLREGELARTAREHRHRPVRWFVVAAGFGVLAAVVASVRGYPAEVHESVVAIGSAVGGAGGWRLGETSDHDGPIPVPIAVVGAVVAGGTWAFAYSQEWLPLVAVGIASAAGIGLVVALPGVVAMRS